MEREGTGRAGERRMRVTPFAFPTLVQNVAVTTSEQTAVVVSQI